MEVLISIGIILMGLAYLACLLPVGRYEIAEAAKRDRSAACGRAVLREIQVRGLIDPNVWVPAPNLDAPFVIDPIGVANGLPLRVTFYNCMYQPPPVGTLWPPATQQALASLLCTWRDELEFDVPDDASVRPRRLFRMSSTGNVSTDVVTDPADVLGGESADNYSWLLTVSPSEAEIEMPPVPPNPDLRTFIRRKFQVAVVVFHKREVGVENLLGVVGPLGLGGGDVTINGGSVGDIRLGEWILVRGQKSVFLPSPPYPGGLFVTRACRKWYRIIAAPEPVGLTRRVTLAGPDWDTTYLMANVDAVHMPGVIGVYTENVEVQR